MRSGMVLAATQAAGLALLLLLPMSPASSAEALVPQGIPGDACPKKVLVLRMPRHVNPEDFYVLWDNPCVSQLQMKKGVWEYPLAFSAGMASMQMLIYHPDFMAAAVSVPTDDATLSRPYSPELRLRPHVPLTVRFVDTRGNPVVGCRASLSLGLGDMEYYRHIDGWSFSPVEVAKAVTDSRGETRVLVPSLLDDPYFAGLRWEKPEFRPHVALPGEDRWRRVWYASSGAIQPRRAYPAPVTVRMTYYGTVDVRLGRAFLAANGATEDALDLWVTGWVHIASAAGEGDREVLMSKDGTASVALEPGTYDISLRLRDEREPQKNKIVPLREGVILRERQVIRIAED